MKVNELIEMLGELDGNLEVRLLQQPTWPLEFRTGGVGTAVRDGVKVAYVMEGNQIGYGPGFGEVEEIEVDR